VQGLQNFAAYYGTRRFNIECTRSLYLSLYNQTNIKDIPSYISPRYLLLLSTDLRLGLPCGFFPFWLSYQNPIRIPFFPVPQTLRPPRLDNSNYIFIVVQIMKLLLLLCHPCSILIFSSALGSQTSQCMFSSVNFRDQVRIHAEPLWVIYLLQNHTKIRCGFFGAFPT
jgi:hypothetical protein